MKHKPRVYEVREILPCKKCGVPIRVMVEPTTDYLGIISKCEEHNPFALLLEEFLRKDFKLELELNSDYVDVFSRFTYGVDFGRADPIIRNVTS